MGNVSLDGSTKKGRVLKPGLRRGVPSNEFESKHRTRSDGFYMLLLQTKVIVRYRQTARDLRCNLALFEYITAFSCQASILSLPILKRCLQDTSSEWFGKASDRYEKLRAKSFHTSEAAELVHSLSFQRELKSTGADSKQKQRYDRFALITPCKSMDPEKEFELKYESTEDALQLARKAHQKFDPNIFKSKAFTVELMSASILKMKRPNSAWVACSADFLLI